MILYFILIIVFILVFLISKDEEKVIVSKHTKQFNRTSLLAVFRALQEIEKSYQRDIQFLINAGVVNKQDVEKAAADLMFNWGEFPNRL